MARKPTFRELYISGQAEPVTPYQKRIARGVNRGLSTAQARGHARREAGEMSISELRIAGRLPDLIGKPRRNRTRGINNRHRLLQFPEGATLANIATVLRDESLTAKDGVLTFQLVVSDGDIRNARKPKRGSDGPRNSAYSSIYGLRHDQIHEIELGEILNKMTLENYYIRRPRYSVNIIDRFGR